MCIRDRAHIAGLVAAGLHESPIPYADVVTSTTHKTLRGPRGGLILSNAAANEKFNFNRAVFPGSQGGPLLHIIAAKAIAFKQALEPEFKEYQKQVLKNAQALAKEMCIRDRLRSISLISIIAIFVLFLFCGTILSSSISGGVNNLSNRLGADIIICLLYTSNFFTNMLIYIW